MKNEETKRFIKVGVILALTLMACISFYFIILRFNGIAALWAGLVSILKSFIYGAVLAYILCPLVNRFEKSFGKKLKPKAASGLAIALSLVVAVVIVVAVILLVLPQLIESLTHIIATLPTNMQQLFDTVEGLLDSYPSVQETLQEYNDTLLQKLMDWSSSVLKILPNILVDLLNQAIGLVMLLKDLLIGVIVSIYLLGTRRQYAVQARLLLHGIFNDKWANLIEGEVLYADKMFHGFLMGKIKDSAIIGVICFIGCLILGFSSPILIAAIIGVTNIIPFFGPFIGAIPCALILLLDSPVQALIFLVFILALQLFDGNILGPKILGNTTGVSSFWVLFAILLFGGIWGIVGMLIGVPLFAVIYDILKKLIYLGLEKNNKGEMIVAYNNEYHAPAEPKPKRKHHFGKNKTEEDQKDMEDQK